MERRPEGRGESGFRMCVEGEPFIGMQTRFLLSFRLHTGERHRHASALRSTQ
jgi:hypothetical protein